MRSDGKITGAIEALQRVIGKAPKYSGPVFRGLSFKTQEDRDAYLAFFKQPTYTTPQFMSTSKNNASALWFADGNFSVFMRIYSGGMNGAALRSFTGNKDMGEDEVLFKYGTKFVVQENYKPDTKVNPYSWFLKLSEEGSTEPKEMFEIPAFKPKNQ